MVTLAKLAGMSALFVLLALVYGNGVTPYSYRKGKLDIVHIYLTGVFRMMALLEIVGAVLLQFSPSVDVLLYVLLAVWGLGAVIACVLHYSKFAVQFETVKINWREYLNGYFIVLVVLVLAETVILMFFYADQYYPDAYAMGIATRAYQTNELYTENPFTGRPSVFDGKLACSPYIFVIAGLARMTGLHPMTIFHTGLPMLLIPLMYLMVYKLVSFYTEDRSRRCLFVIIYMIVNLLFANYDMNGTAGSFLAIWQGKMVVTCIFVPAVWYYALRAVQKNNLKRWSRLLAVMVAAIFFSPFGAILCPLTVVCIIGYYSVVGRRTDYLVRLGIMLIPAAVAGVVCLIRIG